MLLALDTTTGVVSFALYELATDTLLAEMTWQARRHHTRDVLPTVQEICRRMEVAPSQLTALAVTTGPGSFSGVRAGIAMVKGIALGLPTEPRIIGVPTLTVAAAPYSQLAWSLSPTAVVCAVVQAGRGRFNWCYFGAEDLLFRPAAEDHDAGTAAELALQLAEHGAETLWLVGEIDATLRASIEAIPHVTALDNVSGLRRAGQLARLAPLYFAEGVSDTVDSVQPLYLKAP